MMAVGANRAADTKSRKPLTVLVTGSTDGIGRATVTALARQGHCVLIHGRDPEKGRRVVEVIRRDTGSTFLEFFTADLASRRQVRSLAAAVQSRFTRLDVLINNAGVYMPERVMTDEGFEMTFAVNLLAPFLLSRLLLPSLEAAAPARVVNVASIAHFDAEELDWDNLQGERHYDAWQAYALSKLGVILFTDALAERLDPAKVTVNCLHPGVICTKLLYSAFPDYPCDPPETGALTPVYLATSPEVASVTGKYFDGMKEARTSRIAHNNEVRDRFWMMMESLAAGEK